ncbi:hypothetical protein [Bradymonas sediminis]|nr:hypothetical protein [Bradymonas sediminis]
MAPATSFDVQIRSPKSRAALEVSSASVDGDIASAQVLGPGVIRVSASKPGEANIHVKVQRDNAMVEDTLPLVVQAPNTMELRQGCPTDGPYWAGHPAVVLHAFRHEPLPSNANYDGRIFGTGYPPLTSSPALELLHVNGFLSIFSGLDEPGEALLTGELATAAAAPALTIDFEAPPRVESLALMHLQTNAIIDFELQAPVGSTHHLRVVPVGEDGQPMCNTTTAAQVTASTDGCVVRPLDADSYAFTPRAMSPLGLFEVAAEKRLDDCVFEVSLEREGWEFVAEEPVHGTLKTSFYRVD